MTAIAVFCTTNVLLGWFAGYHSIRSYLTFWLLSAFALITARNIVVRMWPRESSGDTVLRIAIASLAIVVFCGLLLGGFGQITVAGYLVAQTTLLVGSMLLPPHQAASVSAEQPPVGSPAGHTLVAGLGGALLAFAVAFAATHAPLTLYDSLSYHLFFPARWLQDHALSIIPTPFSDPAQAYAPANGELFFLWLMVPFHGDLLARIGQLPFALLAATTLYLLARRLGATREAAVYPPAFLLLSRPILEQAIGANVDLICAALFTTSLYLGIVAVDRNQRRDWIFWGVSLGLYWGTKYVALAYTPIFLLLAVAKRPRWRALWALPGILAFAAPWYARNWLVAGSPIYPASLGFAGVTLARGAFDRQAMLNTVFHTNDIRLFPVIAAHALGPTLFLLWLPIAIVGGIAMWRRGWWPAGFVALVPLLMVPLYWFGFPVNVDSRFLMPAVLPALLPFAFVFRRQQSWNTVLHAGLIAGMVWIVVGRQVDIPARVPWFMQGWLSLSGLVQAPFVSFFVALAVAIAAVWRYGPSRSRWAMPFAACLIGVPATVMAVGSERWCLPERCEYLDTTSPYIRLNLIYGWRWLDAHVAGSTIAYTGINLPYPLTGPQLTNRVVYVNIDGRPRWRLHDYDRAYRAGRFSPAPPLLAVSSGELMPIARRPGPRDDALRPRYERMQGIRGAWTDNLRQLDVGFLFVAALSAYEVDYVWHDERGFPIEEAWASGEPQSFRLVYDNPMVRIYAIDLGGKAGA